ncbi:MAG: 1-acyl-sn-glycerol-3-phosphate acyltransferase [Spirochaetes bacterium]|nr:1-acyl-sn-glycerol-3-phosphate acyltransferase [Spirochaetota bacterium]
MRYLLIPVGFLFYVWFILTFIPVTILCALTVIILAPFWPKKHAAKLRHVAEAWGWIGVRLTFCPMYVYGREKVQHQPGIIISNHQSLFDILAGLGFYPIDFLFLSKEEVFKVPLVGLAMKKIGYIPVNRSSPRQAARSLEVVEARVRENNRVLIYPEGTRSKDARKMLPFKAGAFQVAEKGKFPIIPIVLYGTQETRPMHSNVLLFPHRIAIQVLDPILPESELHPANAKSKLSEKEKMAGIRAIVENAYRQLAESKGLKPAVM